ncbi:MAG: ADP-ribosyltransferase domain-containing protein [Pseudanabaena sp.]
MATTTLNQYTQQDYSSINRVLRYGKNHESVEQIIEDLQNVKCFKGTVYRGLTLDKSEISTTFKVSKVYRDMGFMSTSKKEVIAQKFNCLGVPLSKTDNRSITLVIESKTGRDVSKFSQYPEEQEVLFLPLTGFEVLSIEKDGWEEYTIVLKEI